MGTAITLIGLFTLVFVVTFGRKLVHDSSKRTLELSAEDPLTTNSLQVLNTETENGTRLQVEKPIEICWWMRLAALEQSLLALMLMEKALPVWERYVALEEPSYKDLPGLPPHKIDRMLLQTAIREMAGSIGTDEPGHQNKHLKQCYFSFVGPVIAMQDGNWVPPYPVKKIFLSVYYSLKWHLEQQNGSAQTGSLASSISELIDCLTISKMYTSGDLEAIYKGYKNNINLPLPNII